MKLLGPGRGNGRGLLQGLQGLQGRATAWRRVPAPVTSGDPAAVPGREPLVTSGAGLATTLLPVEVDLRDGPGTDPAAPGEGAAEASPRRRDLRGRAQPPRPRRPVVPPAAPPPAPITPQSPFFLVGTGFTIIGALLLLFVLDLLVVGHVHHARDQQTAFADFRAQLANGVAVVNQTDATGQLTELGTPVAVLDIPQIGLREVVLEGTTSAVLQSGAGHRRDSVLPGQAGTSVVLGRRHAYGAPFEYLDQLTPGSAFRVVTGQGTSSYQVTAIRRGDTGAQPLGAGKGRLTLVTADGGPYQPNGVIRVDAALVSAPQLAGPRVLTSSLLPLAERANQGDQSSWVALVLWSQLLLLVSVAILWMRWRWGLWQAWISGLPALLAVGLALCDQVARLLPNLL